MRKSLLLTAALLLVSCASKKDGPLSQDEEKSIDKQGIRKTFYTYRKSLADCYGQSLLVKGQEGLKGVMALKFEINGDGQAQNISQVDEKSSLKNEGLRSCLTEQLKTWQFPSPPAGRTVTVIYPLAFSEAPPENIQKKLDDFEKVKGDKDIQ